MLRERVQNLMKCIVNDAVHLEGTLGTARGLKPPVYEIMKSSNLSFTLDLKKKRTKPQPCFQTSYPSLSKPCLLHYHMIHFESEAKKKKREVGREEHRTHTVCLI